MIKQTLTTFLFLFSLISVTGQSFSSQNDLNNRDFVSLSINPSVIVIIDSVNYEIDSKKADDIKREWIEKVIIMKDDITKKVYGNKNGVIFIYAKRKYKKEILKEIKNNENITF